MKDLEILKSVLGEFFRDNSYQDAIRNLRHSLKNNSVYSHYWKEIISLILSKRFEKGAPLYLMDNSANLPLYANTDEEAYRWLILMLINAAGSEGDEILDYGEFSNLHLK